jgi:phosphonate transport system substrate-binding protein
MRSSHYIYIILIILSLGAALFWGQQSRAANQHQANIIIDFDKVVSEPAQQQQKKILRVAVAAMTSPHTTAIRYHDLLEYLGEQLDMEVMFIQRPTYSEINHLLRDNKIDLAFVCASTYVVGHADFGLELLVIPLINHKKSYTSQIIVAKDSHYTSVEELRNQSFAFTNPESNSGYHYVYYYLYQRGETAEQFFSSSLFTNGHDNSILAVSNGLVAGAAVDSLILDHMRVHKNPAALQVRIIHTSPDFGIPPVVVPPQMDPNLKQRLQQLFLNAHKNSQGRKILDDLLINIFTIGDDKNYNSVRETSITWQDNQ